MGGLSITSPTMIVGGKGAFGLRFFLYKMCILGLLYCEYRDQSCSQPRFLHLTTPMGERPKIIKLGTLQWEQSQCGDTGRVWGQSLTRLLEAIKITTPPDAL